MKIKRIAALLGVMACLASSTAFASIDPYMTVNLKSTNADSAAVVQVLKTKDKNYYQYYNANFGYVVDIPKDFKNADESGNGDGAYFHDQKDRAVITTYAAQNSLEFDIDGLYNMDLGLNDSPELTTNIKTKNSYIIAWTEGKVSYYHELYINEAARTYSAFTVTYPTNKKDKYAEIIKHMDRSFVPAGVKM